MAIRVRDRDEENSRETQGGERRNRVAASGRSVVVYRGTAGTHVQQVKSRYRGTSFISQRLASPGRRKILFVALLPKLRVIRDSIRNLKNDTCRARWYVEWNFSALYHHISIFCPVLFRRPTTLSDIFPGVQLCLRANKKIIIIINIRRIRWSRVANSRDSYRNIAQLRIISMVHIEKMTLGISRFKRGTLRRFSFLRRIALSALVHLHSYHFVLWIGSYLKFSLPFEFSRTGVTTRS